jgi:hypothetical protein
VKQPTTLADNQGTNPIFTGNANAIVPFSAGTWVAQAYHSPACTRSSCAACLAPGAGQNEYGCDVNGALGLNSINGTAPAVGTGSTTTINPSFSPDFVRNLYDVVRYSTTTKDHIPAYLEPFFAASRASTPGWFCSSTAAADIADYGFLPTSNCGLGS